MRTPEIPITLNLYAFTAIIDPPAELQEKMVDPFDAAMVVAAPYVDAAAALADADLAVQFPGAGKITCMPAVQIGRTDEWTSIALDGSRPNLPNRDKDFPNCYVIWRQHG